MITPLDIENKKFNRQMMNGYNVEEVDDFLDQVLESYEKNYKELNTITSKVEELTISLNHYKNIQTTAEEVKNVAKQQSEQIVNEAKKQADEMLRVSKENSKRTLDELESQTKTKEKELDDLKKQLDIYKAKMESLLMSQLELIKEINKDN